MPGEKFKDINKLAAHQISEILSKITRAPFQVEFFQVETTPAKELSAESPLFLAPEEMVAGIHLAIIGQVDGTALLTFPLESAYRISDFFLLRAPGTARRLSALEESALKEIGNIVIGGYVSVLCNVLKLNVLYRVPDLSVGMFGALTSQFRAEFVYLASSAALLVTVNFGVGNELMKGCLEILFDKTRFDQLEGP